MYGRSSVFFSYVLMCYQENENEAHYLREHRGELIEELAKTIMQKVRPKIQNLLNTFDAV